MRNLTHYRSGTHRDTPIAPNQNWQHATKTDVAHQWIVDMIEGNLVYLRRPDAPEGTHSRHITVYGLRRDYILLDDTLVVEEDDATSRFETWLQEDAVVETRHGEPTIDEPDERDTLIAELRLQLNGQIAVISGALLAQANAEKELKEARDSIDNLNEYSNKLAKAVVLKDEALTAARADSAKLLTELRESEKEKMKLLNETGILQSRCNSLTRAVETANSKYENYKAETEKMLDEIQPKAQADNRSIFQKIFG